MNLHGKEWNSNSVNARLRHDVYNVNFLPFSFACM